MKVSGAMDEGYAIFQHTSPDLWNKLKPLARQMRHEPTPAENALWQQLRGRKLAGAKFRRPIDRFIVDFCYYEAHLIIEVDGGIHDYTIEEDAVRQMFLEALGYKVLRFPNSEVLQHIGQVLEQISAHLLPSDSPSPSGEGAGGEVNHL